MLRLVLTALAIYFLWKLMSRLARPRSAKAPAREITAGEMVACSQCGTFVIRSEAVEKSGKFYCNVKCVK